MDRGSSRAKFKCAISKEGGSGRSGIGKTAAHRSEKSNASPLALPLHPHLCTLTHSRLRSCRAYRTLSRHPQSRHTHPRQPLVAAKAPPAPRPRLCSSSISKLFLSGRPRTSSTTCHPPPLTSKADLERALFDFNANGSVDGETSQLPHSSLSVVLLLCGEESRRPRPHSSLVLEPFKPP
jgi:hypothetical protein